MNRCIQFDCGSLHRMMFHTCFSAHPKNYCLFPRDKEKPVFVGIYSLWDLDKLLPNLLNNEISGLVNRLCSVFSLLDWNNLALRVFLTDLDRSAWVFLFGCLWLNRMIRRESSHRMLLLWRLFLMTFYFYYLYEFIIFNFLNL